MKIRNLLEMKKWLLLLLALTLIIVSGCASEQQTIKIGGVFHLSGPGAFWGQGELNGALLAVEDINEQGGIHGIPIELIVEDAETDFPKTVSAITKLSEVDQVAAIIGPTWFGQVASPLAKQYQMIMITPSAGTVPEPNSYFFDVWPTERQETLATVQHMHASKVNSVVVVYSLNDWSESMKNTFIEEAGNITIKEVIATQPDQDDFRSILLKINQLNPDAVYAPFAFYPSQGEFSKQAKELSMKPVLYSSSGTENPALFEAYPQIESTYYPYPLKSEKELAFRDRYEKSYSQPMSPPAAYAYDSMMILAMALEQSDNPEEISTYLHSITYEGISNTIAFDDNGRVIQKEHEIKVVRDKAFVSLSD